MSAVVTLTDPQKDLLNRLHFADAVTEAFRGGEDAQHVYFFQRGEDGPIKIGASNDLARRFREIQTGCAEPLRVLGVVVLGGRQMEQRLHTMFAVDRLHGEWFRPTQFLYEVISDYAGAIK